MDKFKEKFVVKSKTTKKNEQQDETRIEYSAYLMSSDSAEGKKLNINLHSDDPINLKIGDELELHVVGFQKQIAEIEKPKEEK